MSYVLSFERVAANLKLLRRVTLVPFTTIVALVALDVVKVAFAVNDTFSNFTYLFASALVGTVAKTVGSGAVPGVTVKSSNVIPLTFISGRPLYGLDTPTKPST